MKARFFDEDKIEEADVKTVRIHLIVTHGNISEIPSQFISECVYDTGDSDDWLEVDVDIETGIIKNWPQGVSGHIGVKVRDSGHYELLDENGHCVTIKYGSVPSKLIPPRDSSYLYWDIDSNGRITSWYNEFDFSDFNYYGEYNSFFEAYFFRSFEQGKKDFFGETFNMISKDLGGSMPKLGISAGYGTMLYSDTSIAIIEERSNAHINDLPKALKQVETFRILFPCYKDYKVYLGLASMSFDEELETECIKQGIAVIKQVDWTVVINDSNLKVF